MTTKHPLNLPKGSVRALLALIVVGSAVAAYFLKENASELLGIAGVIIGYYFKQRDDEKDQN